MWELPSYMTYNHSVTVLRQLAAITPDTVCQCLFTLHHSLLLGPSCVPELVGTNQKARMIIPIRKKDLNVRK
jgi:hypothetical protein